ncbi:DUF2264 domain-containing protein [Streptomyces sp. NPDC050161]|uniref:DUF2264 domain-containing protein n=1 Tax=Streptomyces sp. NPDC050161 TaxID=3365604 RepID=UPI0037BD7CE9
MASLPFPLPADDRGLSPYTGWTRAHWEATADGLLRAALAHATPRHGLLLLPGGRPSFSGTRSDGLEGFARTFLLAALRVAGANGDDPHGFLDRYAQGLAAGTESPVPDGQLTDEHPESWPSLDAVNQAHVEAASIALGLRLTRRWLWDGLDEKVRERVADWLRPALGPSPMDNNWWLFGLTVGGFLADAGIETDRSRTAIDRALARIDEWYVGDGWYSDGPNRSFDHYNGWALHFYPMLHAHLAGDRALLASHGARLHDHLAHAARLFDANGAPLPFGRSLTYRFAATAAPWIGALTGHTPLTPGTTRRLASGALRHFVDRGAVGDEGLLPLGWYGPYPPLIQMYSGPASPYWASKGFVGLLLPSDHPAWTAPEEALPAETSDVALPLGPTGLLVHSTAADGLVRLHNHGSSALHPSFAPYYARFAYSTRTGPAHPGSTDGTDLDGTSGGDPAQLTDNHFALLADGLPTQRGPVTPSGQGPGWAASAHTPHGADGEPLPGVRIHSATLVHDRAELRAHLVTGAAPGTRVCQTGWAVTAEGPAAQLHPVRGYEGPPREIPAGSTLIGPAARTTVLEGTVTDDPQGTLFLALASLTDVPDPAPADTLATVRVTPGLLHVTWADGEVTEMPFPTS